MKISCVDALVPGKDYYEKALHLKEWGFDGIAIYGDSRTWTEKNSEEVKMIPEKCGIDVDEFCLVGDWYGHLLDDDPDIVQKNIKNIIRAIDIAAEVDAITEVEFDAPRKSDISFDYHFYPDPPKELVNRFVKNVRVLCNYAEEKNVKVLLEACNRYEREYNNLQSSSMKLLKLVDCKNTGLLCDLFHMSIDEHDVAETLLKCGSSVKHIHLGDTNRRLPGQGMMDWGKIFEALNEIHYDGYLNLECSVFGDPSKVLPETAEFLQNYL